MLNLYRLVVGSILLLEAYSQNPFTFNATLEQQSAASNDELMTNITDLIDNRGGQPVLAGEEGVSAHLSESIIELTVWQREMLITYFSSLMVDLTITDGPGVVCPTTYGFQLRYMTMFRQNCQTSVLLQVLSVIQFFKCQHSIPPGSCLEEQANPEAPYCYCCLRHRRQSVLAVDVRSCATGACQVVIENVDAPYCTCCHSTAETTTVAESPSPKSTSPYTSEEPSSSTDLTTSKASQTSTPSSVVSSSTPFYTTSNPRFTSRVTTARHSSASSKTAPSSSSTAADSQATTTAGQVMTSHTSSNPTIPPANQVSTKPPTTVVHSST